MAKTAPDDTGEWLRSMPASAERNASIATFTAAWAEHNPYVMPQRAAALSPQEGQQVAQRTRQRLDARPNEIGGSPTTSPRFGPAPTLTP